MSPSPKGARRETSLVRSLLSHPQPQGVQVRVRRLLREGVPARRLEEAQGSLRLFHQRGHPHGGESRLRERRTEEEENQGIEEACRKEEMKM